MFYIRGRRITTYGAWILIVGLIVACGSNPTPTTPVQLPTDPTAVANSTPTVAPSIVNADQWSTFRNEEFRYSILIPPNWTVDDKTKNEVIIFVDRSNGLAGLHILALDRAFTMDEFVRENNKFHQDRAAEYFEAMSSTPIEMANGHYAHRLGYRVQNHPSFCVEILMDYLMVAGNLSYALQGSICEAAEGLYGQEMEAMQRSFRLDSDLAMISRFHRTVSAFIE